jgi:hypothetical protein
LPEEQDPIFIVHNKISISKVMFLTAAAKTKFDEQRNARFDGKIGV